MDVNYYTARSHSHLHMYTLILLSLIIKTSQKLRYMAGVTVKMFLHTDVLIQLLLNTLSGKLDFSGSWSIE